MGFVYDYIRVLVRAVVIFPRHSSSLHLVSIAFLLGRHRPNSNDHLDCFISLTTAHLASSCPTEVEHFENEEFLNFLKSKSSGCGEKGSMNLASFNDKLHD